MLEDRAIEVLKMSDDWWEKSLQEAMDRANLKAPDDPMAPSLEEQENMKKMFTSKEVMGRVIKHMEDEVGIEAVQKFLDGCEAAEETIPPNAPHVFDFIQALGIEVSQCINEAIDLAKALREKPS